MEDMMRLSERSHPGAAPAAAAEVLDLLRGAAHGVFPAALLEAMIARVEDRR